MNYSEKDDLEKKILDKLKKEVLEKDKELRNNQDDLSIREATKEALAEMTSLEKEEIDALYQKIKKEELDILKQKEISWNITKKILYASTAILGTISIALLLYSIYKPERVLFSYLEDFEGETSDFIDEELYAFRSSIEDGAYVHDHNATDMCHFCYSPPVNFTKNYTIILKSTWKNGSYASYGLSLIADVNNYMNFALTKEGKANVSILANSEYVANDWSHKIFTDNSNEHIQRIEVKAGHYEYFLDNKFIRRGPLPPFEFKHASFRSCDHQTINYDEISIKDNETGEYLLKETFDNPSPAMLLDWVTYEKIIYTSEKKEGQFIINHIDEANCDYAGVVLPTIRKDKKWILSTNVTWKEGETNGFGIFFSTTNGELGEFLITRAGKVIYRLAKDNNIIHETNLTSTSFTSKGKESYRLEIQFLDDNKLDFLVNGKKVLSDTHKNKPKIKEIGFSVCGKQLVEFDNIQYEEIK